MKYKKVRPNSYRWVRWVCTIWGMLLLSLVALYIVRQNTFNLLGIVVIVLFGALFTVTILPKVIKAKNISHLIHNHIKDNALYLMEIVHNKERYVFYPKVYWRIDVSTNTLYIRFRLSGNKINLRGLEQGLADRLEKICLNVFEERGFVEYLFEWETEKQLVIYSKEDIQGGQGNTKIPLSPSFIWDYRKTPHFMVAGSTGSGKTTFARFLISSLINQGVRIAYIDIKRDVEMEQFCHGNIMITYAYEMESIATVIREVADELQTRTEDIENIGKGKDYDYGFNPLYIICDEIILMKLLFPKKLYDETIARINSIIVGGRSKAVFCGLITQSALAEYFGNSGIRSNIGLKVALGQMTSTELGMIFGSEFADIKNLRYGEIGSGLIMRNGTDGRPREFVAPYIVNGVLD